MNKVLNTHWLLIAAIVAMAAVSIYVFVGVYHSAPFRVCTPIETTQFDQYQKTISALDGVVDLSIKLATALVGIGAAILIGLKEGIRLTPIAKALILVGTLCFAQSSLYAVWWRMGVAELWLNECLTLISAPRLTSRFDTHYYFFLTGLTTMAVMILATIFITPKHYEVDG